MVHIRKLCIALFVVFCLPASVSAEETTEGGEKYANVYGIIKDIAYTPENMTVSIKPEEGDEIKFKIAGGTILANTRFMTFNTFGEFKEGDEIMAAYKKEQVTDTTDAPNIEGEKTADVIVRLNAAASSARVKADCFDQNYVSSDGAMKLELSAKTDIIDENGKPLTEYDVPDKVSIVFYNHADTDGQIVTAPKRIICFEYVPIAEPEAEPEEPEETAADGAETEDQEPAEGLTADIENVEIIQINEDTYMKLRDLAELFEYEVFWNDETKTATLAKGGDHYKITANETEYYFNETAETAQSKAVIIENRMYVIDSFAELLAK